MKTRLSRAALLLIGATALLASASADAETTPGLTVTVYDNLGFNNAPPVPPTGSVAGTTVVSGINQSFDQSPLFGLYEDFVVKYEGFITLPCSCDVQFIALADDGTILYLDDTLITYDWWDKGGGGSISEPVTFQQGISKQITLWFYENGGAAWVQLWWNLNDTWDVVPDEAFSQVASTTTTQPTTTSEPPTTTTQAPTTTTTSVPDTAAPTAETTTTSVQTTTSTAAPSTTTTTSSTLPSTTTTQSLPVSTSTTTIPNIPVESQALSVATDPEQVAALTPAEATEVFAALNVDELSDTEAEALVAAVQEAPAEVRESFEEEVNIFSGAVDTYVPLGSTIPVSQRRALIVVTVTMFAATIVTRQKW